MLRDKRPECCSISNNISAASEASYLSLSRASVGLGAVVCSPLELSCGNMRTEAPLGTLSLLTQGLLRAF